MRYTPYQHEYDDLASMGQRKLLEYFLTRIFEGEEIWGIDDGLEWLSYQKGAKTILPLWPYESLAEENMSHQEFQGAPSAESLEDFIELTLDVLSDEGLVLEIIPFRGKPGSEISPAQLKTILTGMMEAGEYTLDG